MNRIAFLFFISIFILVLFCCYGGYKLNKQHKFDNANKKLIKLLDSVGMLRTLQRHNEALEFIKKQEGFAPKCINDAYNKLTIGHGTTVSKKQCDDLNKIDENAAHWLLSNHTTENKIFELLDGLNILHDINYSVLASLCYNVGIGAFINSKLYSAVRNGNWKKVKEEMLTWHTDPKYQKGFEARLKRQADLIVI